MQHFGILADKLEGGFFGGSEYDTVFNGSKSCRQCGVAAEEMGSGKGPGGNDVFYHNFIAQTVYNIYTQFTFQ